MDAASVYDEHLEISQEYSRTFSTHISSATALDLSLEHICGSSIFRTNLLQTLKIYDVFKEHDTTISLSFEILTKKSKKRKKTQKKRKKNAQKNAENKADNNTKPGLCFFFSFFLVVF